MERGEERDAADHGREHHGEHDERAHEGPAREAGAGKHVRERDAEEHRERGRPQRALDGETDRVARHRVTEIVPEISPGRALEQADQREDEERHRDDGEEHHDERNPSAPTAHWSGGGRNPKLCRVFWPAGDTVYSIHAFARSWLLEATIGAIG